jgi:hypothetical protein
VAASRHAKHLHTVSFLAQGSSSQEGLESQQHNKKPNSQYNTDAGLFR